MTTTRNTLIGPALATSATVALCIGLLITKPQASAFWIGVIIALPLAWAFTEWANRKGSEDNRDWLRYSITGAGMMLAIALLIPFLETLGVLETMSPYLQERLDGFVLGGFLILYGNAMPKRPIPLNVRGITPQEHQALNRYTAMIMMLMGVAAIAAHVFAPPNLNNEVMTLAMFVGAILMISRAVTAKNRASKT